jgi:hypothetical protein
MRNQALFEAGKKTGAFVYTRDWSLGHPLKMPYALRRALVPALDKMCKIEATDSEVTLLDARFCATGALIHCCEFVSGFIQGFLGASPRIGNSFASVPRNARSCGVFRVGERCFSL